MKLAGGSYIITKGLVMAAVAGAVVGNHGLSAFDRALIIGVVSSTIGALGVIGAAWVISRHDRKQK